jgi:hypothetical protein
MFISTALRNTCTKMRLVMQRVFAGSYAIPDELRFRYAESRRQLCLPRAPVILRISSFTLKRNTERTASLQTFTMDRS